MNKVLLWLDDERDPTYGTWLDNYAPEYANDQNSVVWVESYADFCAYITQEGLPDMIAFDHDLGFTNEYYIENNLPSPEPDKTGYDCAKWLIDYCIQHDKELPKWVIQSANPVGADNINGIFISFLKNYSK